jgi:hypothetical protein
MSEPDWTDEAVIQAHMKLKLDECLANKNMKAYNIERLELKITKYREAYYNKQPLVKDYVFDALEDKLRELCPGSPVLGDVGAKV